MRSTSGRAAGDEERPFRRLAAWSGGKGKLSVLRPAFVLQGRQGDEAPPLAGQEKMGGERIESAAAVPEPDCRLILRSSPLIWGRDKGYRIKGKG